MSKFLSIVRETRAKLAEERAALLAEADTIAEEREVFNADRGDEIIARLRAINDEDAAAAEREAEILRAEERAAAAAKAPVFLKRPEQDITPDAAVRMSDADAKAAALTFVERSRDFVADSHRENLTSLIEQRGSDGAAIGRMALATGSDAYQSAWAKYMTGRSLELTEQERSALALGKNNLSAEERAMTSGTGSSGGYFVPVFIDPTMIITGAGSINPMRRIARVRTIGPAFGGWYGVTAAQVTAAWTAEGSAAPDNTPTLTQPNIPVYMAEAFVGVSFQAFDDIANLAGDVLELFNDAKDNLEAVAHITGDGSAKPTGVSFAVAAVTASRTSPATGGALALADVFSTNDALPARFRNGTLGWVAANTVYSKIRQLAMAQNSANSVWTDVSGAVPGTLLGVSRYEASDMDSTLTTGNDVLLVGDFSRYVIVDRVGFSTEFIQNLFDTTTGRPTAQRGWLSHWRTGANVVDVNAFRQLRL